MAHRRRCRCDALLAVAESPQPISRDACQQAVSIWLACRASSSPTAEIGNNTYLTGPSNHCRENPHAAKLSVPGWHDPGPVAVEVFLAPALASPFCGERCRYLDHAHPLGDAAPSQLTMPLGMANSEADGMASKTGLGPYLPGNTILNGLRSWHKHVELFPFQKGP